MNCIKCNKIVVNSAEMCNAIKDGDHIYCPECWITLPKKEKKEETLSEKFINAPGELEMPVSQAIIELMGMVVVLDEKIDALDDMLGIAYSKVAELDERINQLDVQFSSICA